MKQSEQEVEKAKTQANKGRGNRLRKSRNRVIHLLAELCYFPIKAIYNTLKEYQHSRINADLWLNDLKINYKNYYNENLHIEI